MIKINIMGKVPPPIGGVTIHTLRLYKWLQKENDVVVKISSLNNTQSEDENINFIGNYPLWILKKIAFGIKEDILHYQGANYTGLIVLYIIKLLRPDFKLILSIHGEGYIKRLENRKILNKILYYILNRLDLIIASGEHLKKQLLSVNIASSITVIDPFLMPLEDDKKEYPQYIKDIVNTDKFMICANAYNVDKIDEESDLYGLHLLSKIAIKLNDENIDYRMIILISNINDQAYIDKLFLDLKNVNVVSDDNVNGWQVMAESNLMIRPTSTDGDALSIKEALSSGVDVIASDVTPRNENVILFNYHDVDDLYEKVFKNIKDDTNNLLGKNCIENNIMYYIKNYKELVRSVSDN
jgi:glycosyltransferase involved in cell wall biosynthesis